MFALLLLIPATMLAVAGYVVVVLSNRSEGRLKSFGKFLAIWVWVLAGLVVLGGILAASRHHNRWGGAMMRGDQRYQQHWHRDDEDGPSAPDNATSAPDAAAPAGTPAPRGAPK